MAEGPKAFGTTVNPKEWIGASRDVITEITKMSALFIALNDDSTKFVETLKSMEEELGVSSLRLGNLAKSFNDLATGLAPALIAQAQ